MDIQEIKNKVYLGLEYLSVTDPSIWKTPEINICAHLRSALSNEFKVHNVDIELKKHTNQRPDISIHIRNTNTDNLVVFEVKINPTVKQAEKDLGKIMETYFSKPYCYKYGIFISIGKMPKITDYDPAKIALFSVNGLGKIEIY